MSDTTTLEWTLGDRLAKARRHAKLEQDDLAERIGVSRALISQWENDRSEPRYSALRIWAAACDAPLQWLMGDSASVQEQIGDSWQPSLPLYTTDVAA